jgi:hypothetical protein
MRHAVRSNLILHGVDVEHMIDRSSVGAIAAKESEALRRSLYAAKRGWQLTT